MPIQRCCGRSFREIVTAGSRDTLLIYVWNLQTAQLLETLSGHEGPISCLAFGGDSTTGGAAYLALGSWDQTVRVWDFLSAKSAVDTLKHTSDVTALAFDPTGGTLAVCTLDGQICFWDAKEATQTGRLMVDQISLVGDRASPKRPNATSPAQHASIRLHSRRMARPFLRAAVEVRLPL